MYKSGATLPMAFTTARRAACAVFVLGFTAVTVAVAGGVSDDAENSHREPSLICGTELVQRFDQRQLVENTARKSPELYQAMLADRKRNDRARALSSADTWEFWVANQATGEYEKVTATKVWEGEHARVWVDNTDRANTARNNAIVNALPALVRSIDSTTGATSRKSVQGIILNDEDVFGPVPTQFTDAWEGKTNFLLTDIKDDMAGGYIGGFFSPVDQSQDVGSNQMNLLYVDSKEGIQAGATSLAGTIAHEFQHLIHFGLNPYSELVLNEGCSEVASILNGYRDRSNSSFLSNTNVDLFRWSYGNSTLLLADYERGMTLIHYLYEQYGEEFLTELVKSRVAGVARIGDALKNSGSTDDWATALKNFAVANYLRSFSANPRYGYTTALSGSAAKIARSYTGSAVPADSAIHIESYGSTYRAYLNPQGQLKLRFSGNSFTQFSVMAIVYRGSEISVTEMIKNVDYTIGQNGIPDKVVLVYVNLTSAAQDIRTTAQVNTVAGVEQNSSSVAGLALLDNAPNPVVNSSTLRFTTATGGSVSLAIYDAQGRIMQQVIDGDRYEAGEHSITFNAEGLASGWYLLTLRQGEQKVSRPLMVVR